MSTHWLPALELFEDYQGDWDRYLEAVYACYLADFVRHHPAHRGQRVLTRRSPESRGKGATFWHLISEGAVEEERLPDLRRCERIRWPRPLIECLEEERVRLWKRKDPDGIRVLIAPADFSYVVVLAERPDHLFLITAFFVEREHRREKLSREYAMATKNAGPAPS